MGWWSNHPMGGDDPLDQICYFKSRILFKDSDPDQEVEEAALREKLLSLTPEMQTEIRNQFFGDPYAYAIPYLFVEQEAFDVTEDVKELLKDLLRSSITATFENICPITTSYSDHDFQYGNLLGLDVPQESTLYFIYWQQLFLEHFDEIFKGRFRLTEDIGLLNTMRGLKSEKPDAIDDELRQLLTNFGPLDPFLGWCCTLDSFATDHFNEHSDAIRRFLRCLAERGDHDAQSLIVEHGSWFSTTPENKKLLLSCMYEFMSNCDDEWRYDVFMQEYETEEDYIYIIDDCISDASLDSLWKDAKEVEKILDIIFYLAHNVNDLILYKEEVDENPNFSNLKHQYVFSINACFAYRLALSSDKEYAEDIVDKFITDPLCENTMDDFDFFKDDLYDLEEYGLSGLYSSLFFLRYWIKRNYDLGMKMVNAMLPVVDLVDYCMQVISDKDEEMREDLIEFAIQSLSECRYASEKDKKKGRRLIECLTNLRDAAAERKRERLH